MATKTFSSRADEKALAYADAVTREQFGMSFGQYCGSVLIDAVCQGVALPTANPNANDKRADAVAKMKALSQRQHDPAVGRMSDDQIKHLIASRYE